MSVAIVIVNYRTAGLTVDCLRSLEADEYLVRHGRVIVVDNASGDDSCEVIGRAIRKNGWSDWVEMIPAERNGGFAYGNNIGIRAAFGTDSPRPASSGSLCAPPDYVLLLNPDTIVRPGAIESLVRFMGAHPKVGIAGSRLEGLDGTPQRSAFRFPSFCSELDGAMGLGVVSWLLKRCVVAPPARNEPHETDWIAGASMIIRRDVPEQIGLLDEDYFMYYEEVDFCLRARRAGWECWYVPDSRVVHLVGKASGINSADLKPRRRPAYWFESRRRYFQKNHGRLYAALTDLVWLIGNATWKIRRAVQRRPDTTPPYFWRDMFRHSSLWHGIQV